ncbi:hypothetical protein [Kribbella sp. NPDC051137]|uniref:hypothetical protein n=1 Tax=Kribbella sp. NPDC051137 TaxID=3155045 RepID=UPI00342D1E02
MNPDTTCFVGRGDVLARILRAIDRPEGGNRERAIGTWGIGKTALRHRVAGLVEHSRHALILDLDVQSFAPWARPQPEAECTTDALDMNFRSFTQILLAMSNSCPSLSDKVQSEVSDAVDDLHARLAAIHKAVQIEATVQAGGSIEVSESNLASVTLNEGPEDTLVRIAIRDSVAALTNSFVARVSHMAKGRPVVVMIDSYGSLRGHVVADWLAQLVAELPNATTLFLATDATEAPEHSETLRLEPFSRAEVAEYLRTRFGAAASDDLVEEVTSISDGLPFVVALAGDVLEQRGIQGRPMTLREEKLTGLEDLYDLVIREMPDPLVRSVLEKGRIARQLDRGVVQYLLFGTEGPQHSDHWATAGSVLTKLVRYSFVEQVDPERGTFRFHQYLRDSAVGPGGGTDLDAESVHRDLANLWSSRRADIESQFDEGGGDSARSNRLGYYGAWYVYEEPDWQHATLEWLHHAGRLTERADRLSVALEFTNLFLRAFWWFGCYTAFQFCPLLLDTWEDSQPISGQLLARHLRTLLTGYPLGWQKLDRGNWTAVRGALRGIRHDLKGELHGDHPRLHLPVAEDGAHAMGHEGVWALLSLFEAHSYRYQTGHQAHAIPLYDDALNWFRATGDATCGVWTEFEKADLMLELGRYSAAADIAQTAAASLDDEGPCPDHELLANLHRVISAATVATNAKGSARHAGYAMLHAYAFLVEPHPPDAYVLDFYNEVRDRTTSILSSLASRGAPNANAEILNEFVAVTAPLRSGVVDDRGALEALNEGDCPRAAVLLTPQPPPPDNEDAMFQVEDTVALIQDNWDLGSEFAT